MPVSTALSPWAIPAVIVVLSALVAGMVAAALIHSARIRESERRFRLLFDGVFDAIVLIDRAWEISDANESFCQLLVLEKKAVLRLPLESLVTREKWPGLQQELIKVMSSGFGYRGETDFLTGEDKIMHIEMGATKIDIAGQSYLLASFRDIGQRVEFERELQSKNTALSELLLHLEDEKMKFRRQVAQEIDETLIPLVDKMAGTDGHQVGTKHQALRQGLEELAATAGGLAHTYCRLTPREIEICNLVRTGKTSKDIAADLDISILTVNKHRERIRKKLVITKKDVNLSSFLKNSS